MTFEDVLDRAIAMLQRRGRVTYRTLKRQFNLDDETLEAYISHFWNVMVSSRG